MGMYWCSRCDALKDDDYDVCVNDPEGGGRDNYGLMCGACAEQYLDENGNLIEENEDE